jgi:MFS family permease
MSLGMFLFMVSFNLILPELNQYITMLGGQNQKGLIITLFTISAAISRPFSGKLSDLIGRKKVMLFGALISVAVLLLYPLFHAVYFFLILRFLHGFSVGFLPTGATALITDLLPEERRGKAMGIWGTCISLGIGVGQSLGSIIFLHLGINNLFFIASGVAFISLIVVQNVNETLKHAKSFNKKMLKISWNDVLEPSVLPAAIVMYLTAVSSGIIFVLTPDISTFLGIENKGWFFLLYVVSTVLIRLIIGSLSDKIGRRKTLLMGVVFLIASMLMTAYATSFELYSFAAILFGIATGITSPTLFAWTADLSHKERRGVGSGTMFIALELGIMSGSSSTLFTYNNSPETISSGFFVGIIMAGVALIYLIWHLMKRTSHT